MHLNAGLCEGKICMPSRKDLENFLQLYVNIESRREYKREIKMNDIWRGCLTTRSGARICP